MSHAYFNAADEYWDYRESKTDMIDNMLEDLIDVLGPGHKLTKKIDKMTTKGSPDLYDVASKIIAAIKKGKVPADLLDRLHALNSFSLDDDPPGGAGTAGLHISGGPVETVIEPIDSEGNSTGAAIKWSAPDGDLTRPEIIKAFNAAVDNYYNVRIIDDPEGLANEGDLMEKWLVSYIMDTMGSFSGQPSNPKLADPRKILKKIGLW